MGWATSFCSVSFFFEFCYKIWYFLFCLLDFLFNSPSFFAEHAGEVDFRLKRDAAFRVYGDDEVAVYILDACRECGRSAFESGDFTSERIETVFSTEKMLVSFTFYARREKS